MYCGFALRADAIGVAETPERRRVQSQTEAELPRYIIATLRDKDLTEDQINNAAALLGLSVFELSKALDVLGVAPLSVNATIEGAEALRSELMLCGLDAIIISEQQLELNAAAIEARQMEIRDDSLSMLGARGGGRVSTEWDEVEMLVTGHLHFSTLELEQQRKKRSRKIIAERRFSADEAILDIYLRNLLVPWRIRSNSFDFSCLGEDKAITAFKNFASLNSLLRHRASKAIFNDDYVRLRPVLDKIWPTENSEQPRQRRRAGLRELEASVTHSNNEAQFDRYSRTVRFAWKQM